MISQIEENLWLIVKHVGNSTGAKVTRHKYTTASSKLWKQMIQTVLTSQQRKSGFRLHVKQYVCVWQFMETVENKLRNPQASLS